jgi:hypothetical protein
MLLHVFSLSVISPVRAGLLKLAGIAAAISGHLKYKHAITVSISNSQGSVIKAEWRCAEACAQNYKQQDNFAVQVQSHQ